MEFCINKFFTYDLGDSLMIYTKRTGVKLKSKVLSDLINLLKNEYKFSIKKSELEQLCSSYNCDVNATIDFLSKIFVLIPKTEKMFSEIILNIDDDNIYNTLKDSLSDEIKVICDNNYQYEGEEYTLTLFYRNNYTSKNFDVIYEQLTDRDYIITAGLVSSTLVIDNLYYKSSGLPSHFSGLNNIFSTINNNLSITRNNWLLFYRELAKNNIYDIPDPEVNACQKAYAAYCLYQFTRQFTNFWTAPTTLDSINWFWHVNLDNFEIFKEVATHAVYSEYELNLNSHDTALCEAS